MFDRLVLNGCSYMAYYHKGGGTADLCQQLNIKKQQSLAKNSVCNSRIIRTTLRDMYSADEPTFYVIGITFVHRFELTTLACSTDDGHWNSFNGLTVHQFEPRHSQVTDDDLEHFNRAWNNIMYDKELFGDLVYRICSLVDAAKHLGHRILVFNTAEHVVDFVDFSKYSVLENKKEIVDKLYWRSVPWQFEQGATWPREDEVYPENCRHVAPGDHKWLNKFLINYIDQYKILQ